MRCRKRRKRPVVEEVAADVGDAGSSGEGDRAEGQVVEAGSRPRSRTGPDLRVVLVEGDVRVRSGGLGADHDGVVLLPVPSRAHPPKREVSPEADREGSDDRKSPTVAVVLGERGGTAACTVAVRAEHVQRATATGWYGRATCGGERLAR